MADQSGIDHGYGAPFVRLFYQKDSKSLIQELTFQLDSFSYKYDEEDDDVADIELQFESRNEPDREQWKQRTELLLMWGYIQGENSPVRKIYVQDMDWEFSGGKVSLKLKATDKAVSMKFEDSNEVHKNTNIIGVAKKMADTHKIKAFLMGDDNGDPPDFNNVPIKPGEYVGDYLTRVGKSRGGKKFESKRLYVRIPIDNTTINALNDPSTSNKKFDKPAPSIKVLNEEEKKNIDAIIQSVTPDTQRNFKVYENIPQAGKTDAALLKEYLAKQKGGYILDTRDDEITIRRRNFNQAPIKTYTYGGDKGDIISFKPMSKIRSKKSKAMAVGVAGWDPLNKNTYAGTITGLSDSNPTLAKFRQMLRFYTDLSNQPGGGVLKVEQPIKIAQPYLGSIESRSDHAQDYTKVDLGLYSRVTVNDKVAALKKAMDNYIKTLQNGAYDPSGNAEDGYNNAFNERKAAELKMNPATATVYGDPTITVGKIITILGVSKKYSGNYYIISADHRVRSNGFITELQMVRQGHNSPNTLDDTRVGVSGADVNNSVGPTTSEPNKKQLKIKTDK